MGFLSISGCLFGIFALHGFHLTGLAIHGSTILSATAAWGATFILVGLGGRVRLPWISSIHANDRHGILAHGDFALCIIWPRPCWKSRREQSGLALGGSFRIAVLSVPASHRQPAGGRLVFTPVGIGGQTFFYGVADSGIPPYHNLFGSVFNGPRWLTGGTVGPEASVFTPIVLVIVAILFTRVYRENRYEGRPAGFGRQTAATA